MTDQAVKPETDRLDITEPGYWEVRGYHNRGDPWLEQRYSD
jgi:DMSO/TMAO reductase YedYZ molybdopterin-dependent catalytic subunit